VQSAIRLFGDEFGEHLGRACPRPRGLPVPKLLDFDEQAGRFVYDDRYRLKRPDWSYQAPDLLASTWGGEPA
jgi:hypothetical protein